MKNDKDLCVFNKHDDIGVQCTVCFHVDDVMVTSENESMIDIFEEVTTGKYENVSVTRGSRHSYLGRLFDFSGDFKCKVSKTGFLDRLVGEEGIDGRAASPATDMLFEINPDAEKLGATDKERLHCAYYILVCSLGVTLC